ncbi:bifunctional riboflavin kinase/FAD synthetase [Baaleninema sp.]|uniref:bifunctional riboflavin kinase/FAD synthetase n=1 Tax=Baaleninema sp. TaxID=3101197 RepID=UPI003D066B69
MWVTSSLTTVLKPAKVALGNFDGVHLGHQQVIREVLHDATSEADFLTSSSKAADQTSKAGRAYTTVVTFNPHPQEFFSGRKRLLLTPVREKVEYLKILGVEQVVLLPFDRELVSLTPQAFVETILVRHLEAKHVSVGENFRFGCNRSGSVVDLQELAAGYGISSSIVRLRRLEDDRISSSIIRHALELGNLAQANRLLGRPYRLIGTVVKGQQLGRQLGFPTANLKLPDDKFLPRWGVYSTWVELGDGEAMVPGVMNLGCRPTVAGDRPTVEVHLLDWQGDLYDRPLTLHLIGFLRPEHQFDSIATLKGQIQQDCQAAREQLARKPLLKSTASGEPPTVKRGE